jgi:integration host factor subunit alpha
VKRKKETRMTTQVQQISEPGYNTATLLVDVDLKKDGAGMSLRDRFSSQPHRRATITRAELTDAVVRKCRLTRSASAEMLEMVLTEISGALAQGEAVKLRGFGSFRVRSKCARVGRNPKTGVEAAILPRRVLTFKPSPVLSALSNF